MMNAIPISAIWWAWKICPVTIDNSFWRFAFLWVMPLIFYSLIGMIHSEEKVS
jgi:hypothetical protein